MSEHVVVKLCLVVLTFVIPQTAHKLLTSRSRFGDPQRCHICARQLPQTVARVSAHASVYVRTCCGQVVARSAHACDSTNVAHSLNLTFQI